MSVVAKGELRGASGELRDGIDFNCCLRDLVGAEGVGDTFGGLTTGVLGGLDDRLGVTSEIPVLDQVLGCRCMLVR